MAIESSAEPLLRFLFSEPGTFTRGRLPAGVTCSTGISGVELAEAGSAEAESSITIHYNMVHMLVGSMVTIGHL